MHICQGKCEIPRAEIEGQGTTSLLTVDMRRASTQEIAE